MNGEAAPSATRGLATGWPYALILAVGALILLPRLGAFGFWDPWEPKYAQSAREMVARGSYVVPFYLGEIRLAKPILAYWGILTGTQIFGDGEFGARIVGVALALASMLGVYYAVSLLRGRRAGLLAALVLGTMPQFYMLARQAMPDVYLMTSLGCALVFFALGLFGPEQRRNVHFGIGYACFALAILAKGPLLAGVIFLVPLAIHAVARTDVRRLWQPELRADTLRLIVPLLVASVLLAAFSVTSFLFGTAPSWWSSSRTTRANIGALRDRIQEQLSQFHVPEALLLLLAVCALAAAIRSTARRPIRIGRIWAQVAAFGAASAAAIGALVLGDTERQILVASLLGLSACAFTLGSALRRFLRDSPIAADVQPYLKPLAQHVALAAGITLAIAGPWYLAIMTQQGDDFFTEFIIHHNIERAEETINRSGTADFYFRTVIFGLFPWSVFLPIAIASVVEWWRRNLLARYGFETYLLMASCVIFSAFSAAATKFAHYLSPLLIPAAVLIGLVIDRLIERRSSRSATLAWIVASLLYLPPMFDLIREYGSELLVRSITMKDAVPEVAEPGTLFRSILFVIAGMLFASIVIRSRVLVGGLLAGAMLLGVYINASFIPTLSYHKSMRHLWESFETQRKPDERLGYYGDTKHGLFYYSNRKFKRMQADADVAEYLAPGRREFCLVLDENLAGVQSAYAASYPAGALFVVDRSHFEYTLISNEPVGEAVPLSEHLAYED